MQLVLLMVSLLFGGEFSHQRENQPCNVMAMGAVGGNGGHDDTAALQRALDDPKCTEVIFPSHHTFSASVRQKCHTMYISIVRVRIQSQGIYCEFS